MSRGSGHLCPGEVGPVSDTAGGSRQRRARQGHGLSHVEFKGDLLKSRSGRVRDEGRLGVDSRVNAKQNFKE